MALRVLLTPLAGMFADRAPNRRFAARTFGIASFLVFLLAWPAEGYWPILVTTGAAMVLYQVTLPVADALALTGVRQFGLDFGRMRFAGSVTFILANLGAGLLLGVVAPESIYFMMLGGFAAVVLVGLTLPVTPRAARALDDAGRPKSRSPRAVLGNPILVAAWWRARSSRRATASPTASPASTGRGAASPASRSAPSGRSASSARSCSSCGRGRSFAKSATSSCVLIGALAAILRWGLFPLDLGFVGTLLMQCLHGLTFGATYLGTQHTIARFVPEQMTASATGFYSMASGILMAGDHGAVRLRSTRRSDRSPSRP